MFKVEVDKTKNLLKDHFAERVDAGEAQRYGDEIQLFLADLRPGFRQLTDLSGLESMDLACLPHIAQVMDACSKAGLKLVVRVIPDPRKDIGLNIMSLFHHRRRIRIVTCKSLEEALTVLGTES
jgi:anti-anti-sigma regulatory factor